MHTPSATSCRDEERSPHRKFMKNIPTKDSRPPAKTRQSATEGPPASAPPLGILGLALAHFEQPVVAVRREGWMRGRGEAGGWAGRVGAGGRQWQSWRERQWLAPLAGLSRGSAVNLLRPAARRFVNRHTL